MAVPKPRFGSKLKRNHWLVPGMIHCVPLIEGNNTPREYVADRPLCVVNEGAAGGGQVQWTRAKSVSGNAAYVGHEGDLCIKSGYVDNLGNILPASTRVFTLFLAITNQTLSITYGSQNTGNITPSGGVITAAQLQTALVGLTNIGTGNATVTGSNNGPFTVTLLSTVAVWPALLAAGGNANPFLQTSIPTPGLRIHFTPLEALKIQTVPSTLTAAFLIKPAQSLVVNGIQRCVDSNVGEPWSFNIGQTNDNTIKGLYGAAGHFDSHAFVLGDWLWIVMVWIGTTSFQMWINGVAQTIVTTNCSLANQWAQAVTGGAAPFNQVSFTNSVYGAPYNGAPTSNVNNGLFSGYWIWYNRALTDSDIQRWLNEGIFNHMAPPSKGFSKHLILPQNAGAIGAGAMGGQSTGVVINE